MITATEYLAMAWCLYKCPLLLDTGPVVGGTKTRHDHAEAAAHPADAAGPAGAGGGARGAPARARG